MNQVVVVTGANRGICLSLCKHYVSLGWAVIAVCRTPSPALSALDVKIVQDIDITLPSSIAALKQSLGDTKIHLLINNAGILRDEKIANLNYETIRYQFEVNTLGPLRVTEALQRNMTDGGKIAFITSRMGSIEDNTSGGRYGYRMSKCALNAAAVSIAHDLADKNIAVAILHPGLVGTNMIGDIGNVTPDQAAEQLASRIEALNITNPATFWHAKDHQLPC
ncbi:MULTISPECIES: SDR family oxidoreductase [unclassified Oleiphilus]|nr:MULTISPECIES: SDR family oxidoreductase [unclassified Oleiphilus]KZY61770.1 short-chain dehydrogenase [Oleiphilus sp. HI0066]KZY70756.1 short-chain dehydrogenase [Oleiphilus sp. HI0067]KZY71901.1 short-chain dehydrogenase [Oleiphilus sp. HI0067]